LAASLLKEFTQRNGTQWEWWQELQARSESARWLRKKPLEKRGGSLPAKIQNF